MHRHQQEQQTWALKGCGCWNGQKQWRRAIYVLHWRRAIYVLYAQSEGYNHRDKHRKEIIRNKKEKLFKLVLLEAKNIIVEI